MYKLMIFIHFSMHLQDQGFYLYIFKKVKQTINNFGSEILQLKLLTDWLTTSLAHNCSNVNNETTLNRYWKNFAYFDNSYPNMYMYPVFGQYSLATLNQYCQYCSANIGEVFASHAQPTLVKYLHHILSQHGSSISSHTYPISCGKMKPILSGKIEPILPKCCQGKLFR